MSKAVDQVVAVGSDNDGGIIGSCVACLVAGVMIFEAFDGMSEWDSRVLKGAVMRRSRSVVPLLSDCRVSVQCELKVRGSIVLQRFGDIGPLLA